MSLRTLSAVLAVAAVLLLQSISLGQTSGMFGSRTLGGGLSGGNRTMAGGSGGLGTGMGAGGQIGANMPTNVGTVDSSDRFVRSNRQAGQFVGSDAGDLQGFLGAIQAGANRAGNNAQGNLRPGGAGNRGTANRGGNNRGGRNQVELRTRLRVMFAHPRPPVAAVNIDLNQRLARVAPLQSMGVRAELRDGTATLQGVVATAHDRAIAERLILLEAGVWRVNNLLEVQSDSRTPTLPSPAPAPVVVPPTPPMVVPTEPPAPAAGTPADTPEEDTPPAPPLPPGAQPEPPPLLPSAG